MVFEKIKYLELRKEYLEKSLEDEQITSKEFEELIILRGILR